LFLFQTVVANSLNNHSSKTILKSVNLFNISWEKHVKDDVFDYAFGVHAVDVNLDGDCDVLGAAQDGDFIAYIMGNFLDRLFFKL